MNRIRSAGIAAALRLCSLRPLWRNRLASPLHARPETSRSPATGGTAQKSQNNWRGRTLIGTAVFNDSGQRIATINDLLITDEGRVDQVVLAFAGCAANSWPCHSANYGLRRAVGRSRWPLRMPRRPPFRGLKTFAVLPGATRDSLAKMEPFRFAP